MPGINCFDFEKRIKPKIFKNGALALVMIMLKTNLILDIQTLLTWRKI